MLLQGKNAVITGCARGIGRSMLTAFASHGAGIWACARTPTPEFESFVADLSADHGVRVTPLYFDLADLTRIKEAVKVIAASKLPVDALVNNAGTTYNALFQMTSLERTREVFEVNFFAPMALTQFIVKIMVRQRSGSIINVASTAAVDANPGRSAYGASKGALICMTRTIAHELAEHGIRANAIAPGITDTDMVSQSMSEATVAATIEQTKLKRMGSPTEIAAAAVFLASDYSSYVTGEILRVDGGLNNWGSA